MKSIGILMAVGFALAANVADAHAHLHMSVPANHSVVALPPKQIRLQFNESVHLTSVTIQKGDGATTKLGPLPDAAATDFALSAPALDAGPYLVKWRVVSDDGHVMAGTVAFSVGTGTK